jgi:hypothetical protein
MERSGDQDKAIWLNEYGWNAAPDSFPEEARPWKRVSEEEQAEYTVKGIEYARENWPWAGVFHIWYFRQVGDIQPQDAAYYFRMVDVDFSPRRVYHAVQKLDTLEANGAPEARFPVVPALLLGVGCVAVAGLLVRSVASTRSRLGNRPRV